MNKQKVIIIHIYFGSLPSWFHLFVKSCERNRNLNFLFFINDTREIQESENICYKRFSINDFNQLVSNKLGEPINLIEPYKLCDFKPFYGKLFEEYIENYDFWGYCDNDIIFGNITDMIMDSLHNNFDVISFYKGFLSGPLCLFKNTDQVKGLFSKSEIFKQVIKTPNYIGFDENIRQPLLRPKLASLIWTYSIYFVRTFGKGVFNWREYRYQFQWEYKKYWNLRRKVLDMTDIVNRMVAMGEIKTSFKEVISSDRKFYRNGRKNWTIKYSSGKLFDCIAKKDITVFHFVDLKKTLPNLVEFEGDTYFIENNGIKSKN